MKRNFSILRIMDFFFTATFCLLGLKYSCGNPYNHIVDDTCRYRFHLHPLPWYQAQEVCRGMDRTLARLDNIEKLELIADMAASNVSSRVPAANLSEIWIGLKAELISRTVYHIWENCEQFGQSDNAIWINSNEGSREGCIAISPNVTKYKAVDCDEARPYICETQDTVPCYDEIYVRNEITFLKEVYIIEKDNCEYECLNGRIVNDWDPCFGFQDGSRCHIFEAEMSGTSTGQFNERWPIYTIAFIDVNLYTALTATIPSPLGSCIDSIMPSSSIDMSSTMTSSSVLQEEATTGNSHDEITTGQPANEITTEQYLHVTTTEELIEEITAYSRVSYMSNDVIESSETTYTTSALDDITSSTATQPLTAFTSGLKETPVESSTSCPRGGMTSEMISKKIRQIAEDMEGDGGNKDDTCKQVFSENVAGNGCAGDKTFPRGAELMSSINAVRRDIIISKMRRN